MSGQESNDLVVSGGVTSGLTINLHPLPILNISEHYNRVQLTSREPPKLFGALLGTESNREVSIVNSFELIRAGENSGDVEMGGASGSDARIPSGIVLDAAFLESRKEQFKQVFPSLDVIGWYSVGEAPSTDDIAIHAQFTESIDTPVFLLFDPHGISGTQNLPIKVYESALTEGGKETGNQGGQFVELQYGIETGEAERIAVDGVSRGGMGGEVVANLTTQRNAIRMLYDRIAVLLQYITAVINKTAQPDHTILRQISALVATLPTMDANEFQRELMTEYSDVQLTSYLHTLTKQLSALSDVSDCCQVVSTTLCVPS
ncbi:COP9 signalosome complex subunit 6 [Kwoniella heveanensis BCC8398]|uniref:COP9 signalosome complex subunit 6 n=1 Tax=Kwoniella heveanensis BCC8398 TaxID=1296120 RepID=A0A1B9GK69_9TREE|nr:COP9 signalosome complex subunit 6 [Kwoniella heveanensis BCC8398]